SRIVTVTVTAILSVVGFLSAQADKKFVRPLPGQTPPYSLAVAAGGVIYVSGQLPTDEKGNVVAGDITVQAKQVFDNLRTVLQQAGSSLDSVVSTTLMLQNAADFPTLDQIYRQ